MTVRERELNHHADNEPHKNHKHDDCHRQTLATLKKQNFFLARVKQFDADLSGPFQ